MSMYPIASISGTGTPTFSNIPQNFQHLQLRMYLRDQAAQAAASSFLRFNSDTGANYWQHRLSGDGATVTYGANGAYGGYMPLTTIPASTTTALVYGTVIVDILDYSNTNKVKTVRSIGGTDSRGSGYLSFSSGFWNSTAAINSLQCGADTLQNDIYTRIDLYGIAAPTATGA